MSYDAGITCIDDTDFCNGLEPHLLEDSCQIRQLSTIL